MSLYFTCNILYFLICKYLKYVYMYTFMSMMYIYIYVYQYVYHIIRIKIIILQKYKNSISFI